MELKMANLKEVMNKTSHESNLYKDIILELLDCEELSVWEYDFINSVADFDWLSYKQKETITKIYNIYC